MKLFQILDTNPIIIYLKYSNIFIFSMTENLGYSYSNRKSIIFKTFIPEKSL